MRTPGPFFHGSIHADLQPGDRILPASQAGVENWTSYYDTGGGDWRRDSVFMVGPYGKAGQEAGGTDDPVRMEQSAWQQFGPLEEDPEDGPAYVPPKPRDEGPHFRPASAIPYQGQQEMFPR